MKRLLKTDGDPDVKIRVVPMVESHLDTVMQIESEAFTTPWVRQDFLKLLENQESINLAAIVDGQVAGYSCAWCVIDSAELGNIAVAQEMQGLGIGRALLEATIRSCRRKKVESLFLEVRASNSRAVDLYERYGFSRIGLRRGYYNNPDEDALIFKLEL